MSLLSKIYSFYRYRARPRMVKHRGGTQLKWRLDTLLDPLTWSAETVDDTETENVFEREWDVLIILDACRHDTYQETVGETPARITVGSHSKEYIEKTYSEGDFSDVVYIAGNPFFAPHLFKEITGREVDSVFKDVYTTYMDGWSDEHKTVMPDKIVESAIKAEEEHPNARKVVHFMQPHHPFIPSHLQKGDWSRALTDEKPGTNLWEEAEKGNISKEAILEGYRDNLEYVLPYAEEVVKSLSGRIAITADHGTLIGENGRYGHMYGSDVIGLRKVPWDVRKDESKEPTELDIDI